MSEAALILSMLRAGLTYGALLCAWMTLVILGSLRHDPRIWQRDAPEALQQLLGPPPPETRRRPLGWSSLTMVGLVGLSAHLMIAGLPTTAGFGERMPATKGHAALRDWRFHLRAYLIGVVAGVREARRSPIGKCSMCPTTNSTHDQL